MATVPKTRCLHQTAPTWLVDLCLREHAAVQGNINNKPTQQTPASLSPVQLPIQLPSARRTLVVASVLCPEGHPTTAYLLCRPSPRYLPGMKTQSQAGHLRPSIGCRPTRKSLAKGCCKPLKGVRLHASHAVQEKPREYCGW